VAQANAADAHTTAITAPPIAAPLVREVWERQLVTIGVDASCAQSHRTTPLRPPCQTVDAADPLLHEPGYDRVVPDSVRNQRVFRPRQIPLYALLPLVNAATVTRTAVFWASRAAWSARTPAHVLLTVPVLVGERRADRG
jgi:hypothetical protein